MSRWVRLDETHIEHNTSAVALIADKRADMDFRRSGPPTDLRIVRSLLGHPGFAQAFVDAFAQRQVSWVLRVSHSSPTSDGPDVRVAQ